MIVIIVIVVLVVVVVAAIVVDFIAGKEGNSPGILLQSLIS